MSLITDVQRFSIHDGDGIRTTVFFKGCDLKCQWCHNPETQCFKQQLMCDDERCVGCGKCEDACPTRAITVKRGKAVLLQDACTLCGTCTIVCPGNLREITGRETSVKQLIQELMKDELFYEDSGGGVTLSGGEVMLTDMDLIEPLVRYLFDHGIRVNIDTCGYAPYDHFEKILPFIHTFLYDIKLINAQQHEKYTGRDNRLILDNLNKLNKAGARIHIRIPVITEVNGNHLAMQEIRDYLLEHAIKASQISLLPYHDTGSSKYKKLGMAYEGADFHTPSEQQMEEFRKIFYDAGFTQVQIGG